MRFRPERTRLKNNNMNQVCRRGLRIGSASLTLESAAVIPLFLIACVILIMFMDALRIQGEKNLDLSNKARQIAVAAGLSGSSAEGKWIDLRSVETYRFPYAFPGIPKLRCALRARVYPWIGSDTGIRPAGDGEGDGKPGDEMVYVSDYESVYHTDPSCTHLDLTVFMSTTSEIGSLRNEYGEKYRKCDGFPKGYRGTVYATAKGDCYYPSDQYGGIVRHVHMAHASDCAGLRLCERCAARAAAEAAEQAGGSGAAEGGDEAS